MVISHILIYLAARTSLLEDGGTWLGRNHSRALVAHILITGLSCINTPYDSTGTLAQGIR